jgi:hypothetical protein
MPSATSNFERVLEAIDVSHISATVPAEHGKSREGCQIG